jgi:hypothetical protein
MLVKLTRGRMTNEEIQFAEILTFSFWSFDPLFQGPIF